MSREAEQIIVGAARLVRRGWTQRAYARDAKGASATSTAAVAVEWCAVGALRASAHALDLSRSPALVEAVRAVGVAADIKRLREDISVDDLMGWNDSHVRTADDVLMTFERAAGECAARPL